MTEQRTEDGLLLEALRELDHARVFIRTREKMHPEGVRQFDEVWARVRRRLERMSDIQICEHTLMERSHDEQYFQSGCGSYYWVGDEQDPFQFCPYCGNPLVGDE